MGSRVVRWYSMLAIPILACGFGSIVASGDASIASEYDRLMAAGCQPERFDVATPIEARVLRNLPFARAGLRFASAELTALYSGDGGWYQPRDEADNLAADDRNCVERLRRHETRLREQLPIEAEVEAVLTADAGVFWALRRHTGYPNRYRDAYSRSDPDLWSWGFMDGSACGGDGSPEAAGDCAGVAIVCTRPDPDQEEGAAPRCELILAG